MTTSPRCVLILDFDGVLADTEPIQFDCWNQAFHELLGIQIEGSYTQLVGLSLDAIFRLWLRSSVGAVDDLSDSMKQLLLARKNALFLEQAGQLRPMPGSLDLIRRAHEHGWYVAIASRSQRLKLLRVLDLIGMPALFDLILAGEDVIDRSTNRKQHSRAAHLLNSDPQRCVVVEDSASGVADALACGIGHVIGLVHALSEAELRAAGAHETVTHLGAVRLPDYTREV